MKKYIKNTLTSILIASSLISCEDFLEEENPNFISSSTFWSTLEESESNLTSVYGAMLNQYVLSIDTQSLRSDISFAQSRITPAAVSIVWHRQEYNNNTTFFQENWDSMYKVVWRANQVIEGLQSMSEDLKSQERWSQQMGEARFFRGLMHFWLHSNYNNGNIIIRDKIPNGSEEFAKKVSTSEDVIRFFMDDLQYAYDNLPDIQDVRSRVSKGTAAFILGKTYLYQNKFPEAEEKLREVISGSFGYELLQGDDVKTLYTRAGEYSSESIFEINYTSLHQPEDNQWDEEAFSNRWARYTGPREATGSFTLAFSPTAWLTNAYMNEVKSSTDPRNLNSSGLERSVPLRCAQMIAVVNDEESEYYGSTPGSEFVGFGNTMFSWFKKLTNHDLVTNESQDLGINWKSSKNVVVYRLSDAYLMLAECMLEKDTPDIPEAIANINIVRERWGLKQLVGTYNATPDDDKEIFKDQTSGDFATTSYLVKLKDHLRHVEKPLELSLEGYAERSTDLRRWGVYKQRLDYLAGLDFHTINYTNTLGTTRANSLLQKGVSPTPGNRNTVISEFQASSSNYIEDIHAYLPLPLTETSFNINID